MTPLHSIPQSPSIPVTVSEFTRVGDKIEHVETYDALIVGWKVTHTPEDEAYGGADKGDTDYVAVVWREGSHMAMPLDLSYIYKVMPR